MRGKTDQLSFEEKEARHNLYFGSDTFVVPNEFWKKEHIFQAMSTECVPFVKQVLDHFPDIAEDFYMAHMCFKFAIEHDHVQLLDVLIAKFDYPETVRYLGVNKFLSLAVSCGLNKTFDRIFELGCFSGPELNNAIVLSLKKFHRDTFSALLNHPFAEPSFDRHEGIRWAIKRENVEAVALFMAHPKIDLMRDKATVLRFALKNGNEEIIELVHQVYNKQVEANKN